MWRPGNAALSRLEKHNRVARPTESARRPGRKFSRGGGLELQSGYALPPFQAAAFPRLILIDAESQVDCRAAAITGTYRKLGPDHAGRYLASFAWRYNRRYQLQTMIPRFVHSAARTQPMPYRLLIAG